MRHLLGFLRTVDKFFLCDGTGFGTVTSTSQSKVRFANLDNSSPQYL